MQLTFAGDGERFNFGSNNAAHIWLEMRNLLDWALISVVIEQPKCKSCSCLDFLFCFLNCKQSIFFWLKVWLPIWAVQGDSLTRIISNTVGNSALDELLDLYYVPLNNYSLSREWDLFTFVREKETRKRISGRDVGNVRWIVLGLWWLFAEDRQQHRLGWSFEKYVLF